MSGVVVSSDLASIHPGVWRAHQLANDTSARIPSGFAALDQQLPGGGWPTRNLIELLLKHHGIGELRFLMPVLRKLSLEKKKTGAHWRTAATTHAGV
ncbi:hypothetical protein BSZ31_11905 [Limnobacter sp. SAORIC-690]|nr:hypothetical protein BSZ31_11905 [Limnobacter sp. SAORIC-690]